MLKKLSEIFENEEIKKLCGDNEENEKHESEIVKSSSDNNKCSQGSIEVKKNDSVISLVTLEQLRESLINENKQDFFSNHTDLKNLYTNTRLKSLDDSIQSIKELDLYKYNESLRNLNQEEEDEDAQKKHKEVSQRRLWKFLKKNETITQLVKNAYGNNNLEKRIEI